MLNALSLANTQAVRRYLLDKVQHMIGGFAKDLESPPGEYQSINYGPCSDLWW